MGALDDELLREIDAEFPFTLEELETFDYGTSSTVFLENHVLFMQVNE